MPPDLGSEAVTFKSLFRCLVPGFGNLRDFFFLPKNSFTGRKSTYERHEQNLFFPAGRTKQIPPLLCFNIADRLQG